MTFCVKLAVWLKSLQLQKKLSTKLDLEYSTDEIILSNFFSLYTKKVNILIEGAEQHIAMSYRFTL